MDLDLEVRGLDEVLEDLEEMGERAEDLTPAMDESAAKLEAFIAQRFATRTAPDGTAWPELKGKSESTGTLAGSVYARSSRDGVAYGASAPHAAYQHATRPFLPTEDDGGPADALIDEIAEAIAEHVAPDATDT